MNDLDLTDELVYRLNSLLSDKEFALKFLHYDILVGFLNDIINKKTNSDGYIGYHLDEEQNVSYFYNTKTSSDVYDSLNETSQNIVDYVLYNEPEDIDERIVQKYHLNSEPKEFYYLNIEHDVGRYINKDEIGKTIKHSVGSCFEIYRTSDFTLIEYDLEVKIKDDKEE